MKKSNVVLKLSLGLLVLFSSSAPGDEAENLTADSREIEIVFQPYEITFDEELAALRLRLDRSPTKDEILRLMSERQRRVQNRDQKLRSERPKYEYDFFLLGRGAPVVQLGSECSSVYIPDIVTSRGDTLKMISYALVYNEGGKGVTFFGHSMQRFDYCRNNQYISILFSEGPKVVNGKSVLFSWLVTNVLENYKARMFKENRSVYEAFLNLSGRQMYQALMLNAKRYARQSDTLARNLPLAAYNALKNSCVNAYVDTMGKIVPGYMDFAEGPSKTIPGELFKYTVKRQTNRVVVYPKTLN